MKNMKTKITALFILIAVTLNVSAQEYSVSDNFLNRAEKNFIATMDSDVNSLVESAIFNMLIFKDRFPKWNFENIENALNTLAVKGNSLSIRYKAQLAGIFIRYPEMFSNIKITDKDNPAKYFRLISERLNNRIIAAN